MLHFANNTPPQRGGSPLLHPRSLSVLNAYFSAQPTQDLLDYVFSGALGQIAMVSSFGAEAAVLLHLVARVAPTTPVFFLDTELLFAETLAYQSALSDQLGLTNVRILRANTRIA